MNTNELQTLLDINSATSFQDLQRKTSYRLDAMQRSMALEGYYNGTWENKSELSKLIKVLAPYET